MPDTVVFIDNSEIATFVKALHSPVRREIFELLRTRTLTVNQVATKFGISQSSAVTHIQALEKAGLVSTQLVPAKNGVKKLCSSGIESVVVVFRPRLEPAAQSRVVTEMPVGLFFDHEVRPTCGMASETGFIGYADHPASFLDSRRRLAQIIWFEFGYVEYRMPVTVQRPGTIQSVAVSAEICSEFPRHNADWPSDITVWMNGLEIGTFRSPGDPGDRRGHLNPAWWGPGSTQYGFLKEWRVTPDGSFIDGVRASDVVLADLSIESQPSIRVRFGIKDDAEFTGGINILGSRFGNYPQDIRLTVELGGASG